MSLEDKYKKKNSDIQQRLRREMEYIQLSNILEELKNMMNNKCLILCYPRIIVDSWDFNDDLGIELLDLAELYKRWK